MATVSSTIIVIDRFTQPLQRFIDKMAAASAAAERLKRIMESLKFAVSIKITVNAASVLAVVNALRERIIAQIGTIESEIQLSLPANLTDMLTNLRRLVLSLTWAVRKLRQSLGASNNASSPAQPGGGSGSGTGGSAGGAGSGQSGGGFAWLGKLRDKAVSSLNVENAQKLIGATIGEALNEEKLKSMFVARTGSTEVGTAMFEKYKSEALAAGQDVNKSLGGTLSFFSSTQNSDQLSELNKLASMMAAFDSEGNGIAGAALALNDALSGDMTSLSKRFNMSENEIKEYGIDQYAKDNNMEGFIQAFQKMLSANKMGPEAYNALNGTPTKQVDQLSNNAKSAMGDAGGAALASLLPMVTMLNEAFKAGKFQPFFDGLSAGLRLVADMVVFLVEKALWLHGVILDNWPLIAPILWGIVIAIGYWRAVMLQAAINQLYLTFITGQSTLAVFRQTLATHGLRAAWAGLNATMKTNIFILLISVIIGLVMWIRNLWMTNDEFAAGMMRAWNAILNFFDKIPAFFWQTVEWIFQAFVWMAGSIGEVYDAVINGIIDGINEVLEVVNKVTGSSYKVQAEFDFEKVSKAALAFAGMQKDAAYENAAKRAAEREKETQEWSNQRAANRAEKEAAKEPPYDFTAYNEGLKNTQPPVIADPVAANIDKVGEVGKINDSVDVASEDLKTMRELAEMKNIQNFVSLTPSVNYTHNGDVRSESDIRKIVTGVKEYMEGELAVSAKGVYA